MVILFQSKPVLEHLLKHGIVYTFRTRLRKKTGKDWCTDKRGGKKLYDVEIYYMKPADGDKDLESYISDSGFNSINEWKNEIKKLNKTEFMPCGYIYMVTNESIFKPDPETNVKVLLIYYHKSKKDQIHKLVNENLDLQKINRIGGCEVTEPYDGQEPEDIWLFLHKKEFLFEKEMKKVHERLKK